MAKSVTLVEFSVFDRIIPLASGYLQSYAMNDPFIRKEYAFEKYTTTVKSPRDRIIRDLIEHDSDVYAFSCYVWNMGLIKSLLPDLLSAKPEAQFLLGGPQVMKHGRRYLDAANENVAVCNGEGEAVFSDYLRQLTEAAPDLNHVDGLSFYRDGELCTTEKRERIRSLEDIPSPYLAGVFDDDYSIAILETNRGCPFRCGFCYWGAANNDRVHKFEEERIIEEINWISRNKLMYLYIADANFGMLKRDITLSKHLVDCAHENKSPNFVYFSTAKNSPSRVADITEILTDGGLLTSQTVSMQTLNQTSLALIDRSNIKLDAYAALQDQLQQKEISSFVELIWPLPGETLTSFQEGIATLCTSGAETIIAYPHLLLNNTSIYNNQDKHGIVTRPASDGVSEAQLVVSTSNVSLEEFADGMRFFYVLHVLNNMHSLYHLGHYLSGEGIVTFSKLFASFVQFWKDRPIDPITEFVETSIDEAGYYDLTNYGMLAHKVMHEHRSLFTTHLHEYVRSQHWWNNNKVRATFEMDMINRPYVYNNTPIDEGDYRLEALEVLERKGRSLIVDVKHQWIDLVPRKAPDAPEAKGTVFRVDHKRTQFPFMKMQSTENNANYCLGMVEKIRGILPTWTSL